LPKVSPQERNLVLQLLELGRASRGRLRVLEHLAVVSAL
jgi:hypothetical protein